MSLKDIFNAEQKKKNNLTTVTYQSLTSFDGDSSEIESIDFDKRVKLLTSIEKMLQIPLLELDNNQMQQILNGQLIELTLLSGEYALMNQKKFLGIGQSDGNFIKPIRLIKNEIN